MNKETIECEFDRAIKENDFLPFFDTLKPYLEKIDEIEKPYLFLSSGRGLAELEFEKMLNQKESNYVAIDFYDDNVEIYMAKHRLGKDVEDKWIEFDYDQDFVGFINNDCKKFLEEKWNKKN